MSDRAARKAEKAARRVRRARERATRRKQRSLVNVVPPEGVPVRFTLAGLGARAAAQIVDLLLSLIFVAAFLALIAVAADPPGPLLVSLSALLFFAIRTPYYVLAELLWNGRTVGKRMMSVRVISADGRSLGTHAVVVRNLMKEAEVFVPATYIVASSLLGWLGNLILLVWIIALLAVPIINRRRQRLGDIIANTLVIYQPTALLLPDLAATPAGNIDFAFHPHQLDHYGAFELQTLEQLLHASNQTVTTGALAARRQSNMSAVAERIRSKIDFAERVAPEEAEAFLNAFYTAQRKHLEQRQLFGDRRADKHYRAGDGEEG